LKFEARNALALAIYSLEKDRREATHLTSVEV
jgi:hypothetical protein